MDNFNQDHWDRYIPTLTYALNTAHKESIKTTPFEIVFGRKPRLFGPIGVHANDTTLSRQQQLQRLPGVREEARTAILRAQEVYRKRYNKTHVNVSYQIGDIILVHNPATPLGLSPKITRHWGGPYYVSSILSPTTLRVTSLKDPQVTKVVNVRRVKPFHKSYESSDGSNPTQQASAPQTREGKDISENSSPAPLEENLNSHAPLPETSSDLSDSSSTSDTELQRPQEYTTRSGRVTRPTKFYPN